MSDFSGQNNDPSQHDTASHQPYTPPLNDTAAYSQVPYTPPPKSGMGTGAKVGIGCGVLIIALFLVSCLGAGVVFFKSAETGVSSDFDDPEFSTTTSVPSTAAPQTSVTLDAYNRIQNGQSLSEVQSILQDQGRTIASSEFAGLSVSTQVWQAPNFGNITVIFQDDKVQSKTQVGLR